MTGRNMTSASKGKNLFAERKSRLLAEMKSGIPLRHTEIRKIIGSSAWVKHLIDDGAIERLPMGLYGLPSFDNSWQSLSILAITSPKGVICMETAAAYHGLTTANPAEVHIAVPYKQTPPRNNEISTKGYRWQEASMTVGVEEITISNVPVRMTNPARTVVDYLRSMNKLGNPEMAMEVLGNYQGRPAELLKIARAFGAEDAVRPYTQVIQSLGRKL